MATETLDLASVLANLQALDQTQVRIGDALPTAAKTLADLAGERQITTQDERGRTILALQQEMAQEALGTQTARDFATRTGMGPGSSELVAMADELRTSLQAAMGAQEEIQNLNSGNFFTNPLGFIQAKLGMHPAFAQYEAAAGKFNTLSQGMTAINNQIQEVATTQSALKPVLDIAAREERLDALGAHLNNLTRDQQQAAIVAGSKVVEATYALNQDQWNRQRDMAGLQLSIDASNRAAAASADKIGEGDETFLLANYKLGHKLLTGVDAPEIDAKTLMRLYVAKDPKLGVFIRKGMQASITTDADPSYLAYGTNPAEAHSVLTIVNPPLAPMVRATYDAVVGPAVNAANKQELAAKFPTPDARQAFINTAVAARMAQFEKVVDWQDKSNPLVPQSIAALVAPNPSNPKALKAEPIKNTQLYKKVLAPVIATGGLKTANHNEVLELAVAAVEQGKIKPDVAANELADIFAYQSFTNNRERQFARFGVPEPTTYNAAVVLKGQSMPVIGLGTAAMDAIGFNDAKTDVINLRNVNQLKKFLLYRMSNPLTRPFKDNPSEAE